MKKIFILIFILSFSLLAHANTEVRLGATGVDWISYTTQDKRILMSLMFTALNLDREEYSFCSFSTEEPV